jgi:glutathione S-transferase
VPWEEHEAAREWYVKVKARSSFKALLDDRIPGFSPAGHYENVDF